MRCKVACDRPRQGANTRLQEDMGRRFVVLRHRFMRKCRIALHDPKRDLGIAVERRVLHEHPALFLREVRCMAHGVVVVVRCKRCLRTEPADVRETLGRASLRHKDMGKQPKDLCRPCDTAPVVAVCRRDERDLAQAVALLRLREVLIRHRTRGEPEVLCKIACDSITRPESLERVQSETSALVLHREPPEPQHRRKPFEIGERCRRIHRQTFVKRDRTRCHICAKRRDIRACTVRMCQLYRLDRFIHRNFLPINRIPTLFFHYNTRTQDW